MRARLAAPYLLLAACSATPAPVLGPMPAAPAPLIASPAPPLVAAPALSEAPPSGEPASPTPPPPTSGPAAPLVVLEPLYSELGHARLATEMMTLARDEELFQWALGGSADPLHPSNQPGYHPATRVVVDVELQSRAPKGTAQRLLRIARSDGYWPLRACFEAAERLTPRRERSARVRLTLGALGKVLGSRRLGPAPEPEYARCVLERVRALNFRPGFSRKLDVDISVKQWPGHAPVPPRAPDQLPAAVALPELATALDALEPVLAACYAEGLKTDARLWGRIAFTLQADAAGAIGLVTPIETRFPSVAVVTCARQAVLDAHLSVLAAARYSFAFRLGQPPAPPPPIAAGSPPSDVPAPPVPEPAPPMPSH